MLSKFYRFFSEIHKWVKSIFTSKKIVFNPRKIGGFIQVTKTSQAPLNTQIYRRITYFLKNGEKRNSLT
nr:MAG TPA: hypothetical protein [Caudoviricetes sp.]